MSYIINNSRGNIVAVVADGTVNTTATPITLVGQGVTSYGTAENENYVWILENFCNTTAPSRPMTGQLWYNNSTDTLSVYNSLNTWTAVASQDYVQAQKVSPTFTGTPTAPTAADGTNNTQLATTRFVGNAVSNYASTASIVYAPLVSPGFSGTPTAPTVTASDNTNQLATTAFVQAQKISPTFTGTPVAPTPNSVDSSTQIATTAFVQAQKDSTVFTGTPIAPTATTTDNSTQIATTAFVQAQKTSPTFTGTPIAPTATTTDNSTQIATTAFVQAQKDSPAFSGVPTAPTADVSTANTQIATTAFVASVINPFTGSLGTIALQNSNNVSITGGSITGISPLAIVSGGTAATNAIDARTNLGIPVFPLNLANGGTGGTTAASARTSLGLGTMAVQDSSSVAITGGTISGISALAIADGGTGATSAAAARTNLGLASGATTTVGTMATQNANAVSITGGTISLLSAPLAVTNGGTGATSAAGARTNLGLASGATTTVGTIATQDAGAVSITGGAVSGISLSAASPSFSGVPTAPTATVGTANTQIATTAFVAAATSNATGTLGTMASQNANAVSITGGTISLLSAPIDIINGGTGATSASAARTNLGISLPLSITNGGTGATNAPSARTSLGLGNVSTININGSTSEYLRGDGNWASIVPSSGYGVGSILELCYDGTVLVQANQTTNGSNLWYPLSVTNSSIIAFYNYVVYNNQGVTQTVWNSTYFGDRALGYVNVFQYQAGGTSLPYVRNPNAQGMTGVWRALGPCGARVTLPEADSNWTSFFMQTQMFQRIS